MTTVDIRLNGPQWKSFELAQPGHTVCHPWGRGVGKSFWLRSKMYQSIARWDGVMRENALDPFPGVRIAILMPTLKQFRAVHGNLMVAELETKWAFLGGKVNRTDWTVSFPGGSWIRPIPAQAHVIDNARGLRVDELKIDEADDVDISVYEAVALPWLSEPWSFKSEEFYGTPKRGRHGLLYARHRDGLDPSLPDYHTIHATYRDAPENVDIRTVEKARRGNPTIFAREWECDFDAGEGLVYPFDETFHVREPPDARFFTEHLIGVDHGWTDPGVFLHIGITGHGNDAVAWVLDEIYESERENSWWNEHTRRLTNQGVRTFWVDPSRPDRIADLCSNGAAAMGADNDIQAGLARIVDLLAKRPIEGPDDAPQQYTSRLFVAPRCRNTIREFGEYRRKRDPKDPDHYLETPEDRNNHCLVAGTEVQTLTGPRPIESVKAGDHVATREGWCPVEWSGMTFESAPIWTAELSNGRTLEGTPDHRVWTQNRGWVRLDSLRYGDILLPWGNTAKASLFGTTGNCSGGTQILRCPTSGTTSDRNAGATCTGSSGRPKSGQSPTGTTSTIATETQRTTTSATLSAYRPRSTHRSTSPRSVACAPESTLTGSGHSPPPGMPQKRGSNGIGSTVESASLTENRQPTHAKCAQPSSGRLRLAMCGSAPTSAKQSGAASRALMTSTAPAQFAAPTSGSTSTPSSEPVAVRVVASRPAERSAPVYDLTVAQAHEFFANGVLVHNSMDALRYALVMRFGRVQYGRTETPGA